MARLDKPTGAGFPSSAADERRVRRPIVLVAEDHEDTRLLYRLVLEPHDYQVVEAATGSEAVKLAKQTCPDIVIMDTSLPDVDGLTVTKQIRAEASLNNVPIVFVSGDARPERRAMALASGGNDYLVKPMSIAALEAAVEKQMAKHMIRRPGQQHSGSLHIQVQH